MPGAFNKKVFIGWGVVIALSGVAFAVENYYIRKYNRREILLAKERIQEVINDENRPISPYYKHLEKYKKSDKFSK